MLINVALIPLILFANLYANALDLPGIYISIIHGCERGIANYLSNNALNYSLV